MANLKENLDQIREKPEATRRSITLVTSLAVTALIGGMWLTTLDDRFRGDGAMYESGLAEKARSPFDIFDREEFSGLQAQVGAINN